MLDARLVRREGRELRHDPPAGRGAGRGARRGGAHGLHPRRHHAPITGKGTRRPLTDIKIGIVGAARRMGKMLIGEAGATPGAVLAAASERAGHEAVGQDAGTFAGLKPVGVRIGAAAEDVFKASDVVIDFTVPKATAVHAALAVSAKKALVIGTTGI